MQLRKYKVVEWHRDNVQGETVKTYRLTVRRRDGYTLDLAVLRVRICETTEGSLRLDDDIGFNLPNLPYDLRNKVKDFVFTKECELRSADRRKREFAEKAMQKHAALVAAMAEKERPDPFVAYGKLPLPTAKVFRV